MTCRFAPLPNFRGAHDAQDGPRRVRNGFARARVHPAPRMPADDDAPVFGCRI